MTSILMESELQYMWRRQREGVRTQKEKEPSVAHYSLLILKEMLLQFLYSSLDMQFVTLLVILLCSCSPHPPL